MRWSLLENLDMARYCFCFLLFCGVYFSTRRIVAAKSGPYISTLVRVEKCKIPSQPYQKDPCGDVTMQLYEAGRKKLLRGNYTAFKPESGLRLTVQDYSLVDGEWKPTFRIGGMSCRGRIANMIMLIFNVKFNKKTCLIPKGVYLFNNIDYDFVDHVFAMTREYGRALRKVEVGSKMGTMVCLEMESVVNALRP